MPTSANSAKVRDQNQEKRSRVQLKNQLSTVNHHEYSNQTKYNVTSNLDSNKFKGTNKSVDYNQKKENVTANLDSNNKFKENNKNIDDYKTKGNTSTKQSTRVRKNHPTFTSKVTNNMNSTTRVTKLSTRLPKTTIATQQKCSRYASRMDIRNKKEVETSEKTNNNKHAQLSRQLMKKRTQNNSEQVKKQSQNEAKNAKTKQSTNQTESTKHNRSVTTLKIDIKFGEDDDNEIAANVKIEQSKTKNNVGDSKTELDTTAALVVMISGQNETDENMETLIKTGSEIDIDESDDFFECDNFFEKENENIPERDLESSVKDILESIYHEHDHDHKEHTHKDKFSLEKGDGVHILLPPTARTSHNTDDDERIFLNENLKNVQKEIISLLTTTEENFKFKEIFNRSIEEIEDGMSTKVNSQWINDVENKYKIRNEDDPTNEVLVKDNRNHNGNRLEEDGMSKKLNNSTRINAIKIKDEIMNEDDRRTNEAVVKNTKQNGNILKDGEIPTSVIKAIETKHDLLTELEVFNKMIQDIHDNAIENTVNMNAENNKKDKEIVNVIKLLSSFINNVKSENNFKPDNESANKMTARNFVEDEDQINKLETEIEKIIDQVLPSSVTTDVNKIDNLMENSNIMNEIKNTNGTILTHEKKKDCRREYENLKSVENNSSEIINNDTITKDDSSIKGKNNNQIKDMGKESRNEVAMEEQFGTAKETQKIAVLIDLEEPSETEMNYDSIKIETKYNDDNIKNIDYINTNEMIETKESTIIVGNENENNNEMIVNLVENYSEIKHQATPLCMKAQKKHENEQIYENNHSENKTQDKEDIVNNGNIGIEYYDCKEIEKRSLVMKDIRAIDHVKETVEVGNIGNQIQHDEIGEEKYIIHESKLHKSDSTKRFREGEENYTIENNQLHKSNSTKRFREDILSESETSTSEENVLNISNIENKVQKNEENENRMIKNLGDNELSNIIFHIKNEVQGTDNELSNHVENEQMIVLNNYLNPTDKANDELEEIPADEIIKTYFNYNKLKVDKIKATYFYNELKVDNGKTAHAVKASDKELIGNKNLKKPDDIQDKSEDSEDVENIVLRQKVSDNLLLKENNTAKKKSIENIRTESIAKDLADIVLAQKASDTVLEKNDNTEKNSTESITSAKDANSILTENAEKAQVKSVENIALAQKISDNLLPEENNDTAEKKSTENYISENITTGIEKDDNDVTDNIVVRTENVEENAQLEIETGEEKAQDEESVQAQNIEEHEIVKNVLAQNAKELADKLENVLPDNIEEYELLGNVQKVLENVQEDNIEKHKIVRNELAENTEEQELDENVLAENVEKPLENVQNIEENEIVVENVLTQNVQEYDETLEKYVLAENEEENELEENILKRTIEEHELVETYALAKNAQEYYVPSEKYVLAENMENILSKNAEEHTTKPLKNILAHSNVDDVLMENIEKAIENAQEKYDALLLEKNSPNNNTNHDLERISGTNNNDLPDIPEEDSNEPRQSSSLFYIGLSFAMGLLSSGFWYFYSTVRR